MLSTSSVLTDETWRQGELPKGSPPAWGAGQSRPKSAFLREVPKQTWALFKWQNLLSAQQTCLKLLYNPQLNGRKLKIRLPT